MLLPDGKVSETKNKQVNWLNQQVNYRCPPNGLYHVGVCAKGSPIYISFPHFLYADSSVQKSVIGMNPSVDKHEYFMDFDKNLAAPLKVDIRLQVNLLFKKVKEIEIMESWPDNLEIYLPQFWSSTVCF